MAASYDASARACHAARTGGPARCDAADPISRAVIGEPSSPAQGTDPVGGARRAVENLLPVTGVTRSSDYFLKTARLGAEGLFAGHHPEHGASRAVLERLGFRFTHEEVYPPTGLRHPSYLLMRPGSGHRGPASRRP